MLKKLLSDIQAGLTHSDACVYDEHPPPYSGTFASSSSTIDDKLPLDEVHGLVQPSVVFNLPPKRDAARIIKTLPAPAAVAPHRGQWNTRPFRVCLHVRIVTAASNARSDARVKRRTLHFENRRTMKRASAVKIASLFRTRCSFIIRHLTTVRLIRSESDYLQVQQGVTFFIKTASR